MHLAKGGESLADTAKILSTYGNGFMLRTDSDKKIEEFKKYLDVTNVINGLSPIVASYAGAYLIYLLLKKLKRGLFQQ